MKDILILIGFLFCTHIAYGQEPIRAVEGGGGVVNIDSITPLSQLIERLKYPLQFVETGKAYWIGYPDLMFSIAYHKDKAVQPLIDFINRVRSIEAKENALYTLHLIGLESRTGGRFYEEFKNPKARKALLQFMDHYGLHGAVVHLLMRDPWRMDIPYYMEYLSKPHKDYSKVLHALNRFYLLKGRPIGQEIPAYLRKINIKVKYPGSGSCPYITDMIALKKAFGRKVYVDSALTSSEQWKDCFKRIQERNTKSQTSIASALLFKLGGWGSFSSFDSKYFYAFDRGKISIYGFSGARRVWLDWWKMYKHKKLRWEPTPGFHKNG